MGRLLDDWPVTEAVSHYQVVVALMVKEISHNALKWVRGVHQGCWGCTGLGGCNEVAGLASRWHVCDVSKQKNKDAQSEDMEGHSLSDGGMTRQLW
ncbi:hypothetical protein PoB_003318400 [Plakobranchus ocellatus]|uniref:Uncharacterized protein n=1 Tax=Plakobranchus ocellatus TaxID=259542 RepID=A0AAV4AG85_9GAST|nr:hypothetical protein PoB_003318400 [Plakobranchus ocellatus]